MVPQAGVAQRRTSAHDEAEGFVSHGGYDYIRDGAAIYRASFEIIRRESDLSALPPDVECVVVRMIHAAGQTDIAQAVAYTPDVVGRARAALEAGAPVLCDSTMVATGIIRSMLPAGNQVLCYLGDTRVPGLALQLQTTKTAAAVELWREHLEGAVVAIGNAPTALFRLLEVVAEGGPRPAAVIGLPVGFVGATESKQALVDNPFGLAHLTVTGRRGGSAMTAAAINAMFSVASQDVRVPR